MIASLPSNEIHIIIDPVQLPNSSSEATHGSTHVQATRAFGFQKQKKI